MSPVLVRIVIGVLLIVHGFAHYQITTAWGSRQAAAAPLLSAIGLSAATIQSLGTVLWVVALLGFIVAGLVVLIHPAGWQIPTIAAALVSLVTIGLYWMPMAALGAAVDVATLVALWFLAFVAFLASIVAPVARRDWLRPLLAVAGTYVITQLLVFAMPPLWVDAAAALGVIAGVWWLYRAGPRGGPEARVPRTDARGRRAGVSEVWAFAGG